jgi:hypothetical protein
MAEALVVFWLVCGIIAMYIYQNKGRSGAWGCLVGFALGPLGILYAAVRSPRQEKIEERMLRKGERKRCPHCSELIRPEAKVCPFCQRDV